MMSEGVVTHGLISRDAVRDLLYQSDALVLASRSEVQPLVLLEAMSTGIPVIATTCVPQSFRLQDGCRIVAVDDVDGLSAAMADVMIQTVDGQQLSQQVREMASPEVIGRQLVSLFGGLIASN
jgi:glycosyltransferase involved in cell wall biosynthesis